MAYSSLGFGETDTTPLRGKLKLHKMSFGDELGQYTIDYPSTAIKLWKGSQRTGEVKSGDKIDPSKDTELYIEGKTKTPSSEGYDIKLGWKSESTEIKDIDKVKVSLITGKLAVDGNRNGAIDLESTSDKTTQDKPFRFWENDDYDDDTAEYGVPGDKEPAGHKDYADKMITCRRDLEDFTRLHLKISGNSDSIKSGKTKVGLRWRTRTESPAINVYRAINETRDYLTSPEVAGQQISGDYMTAKAEINSSAFVPLPRDLFTELVVNKSLVPLIFEGAGHGKGELVITIKDSNDNEIGELGSVWLDLRRAQDFYQTWSVGDGDGTAPGALSPAGGSNSDETVDEKDKSVVFVHGWDMAPWEKDYFADTAFKRMWHQGYKGRFISFRWPTAYTTAKLEYFRDLQKADSFDRSESIAWQTGALFKSFLVSRTGSVHVFAHSQGNVVVSEALRLATASGESGLIQSYAACQGAVSMAAYASALDSIHPNDLLDFTPQTPEIYREWFSGAGTNIAVSASNVFSFFNESDYALNSDHWERDQRFKPNDLVGPRIPYGYIGNPAQAPVNDGFYGTEGATGGPTQTRLLLSNVNHRYEIMAFAAESRTTAIGASGSTSYSSVSRVNLGGLWTGGDYSGGQWHSGEFRFDYTEQRKFWSQLYRSFFQQEPPTP